MDQFRIYKLIWYKLRGTISAEQKQALTDWLSKSDQRQQWFTRLMDDRQVQEDLKEMQQFDQKKGWERIERRLAPQLSSKRWIRRMAGVAAIAVLVLAVGSLFYLWSHGRQPVQLSQTQVITPGGFNALLSIDDGESILLQDSVTTSISKNKQIVAEVKNGSLAYLADTTVEPVKMEIEVPERSEFHFVLSDGSQLWMNAGSKAIFQQPFAGDRRDIYIEGEAYFQVTRDETRPFIVDICGINNLQVLGTSFNVKAYPSDRYQQSVLVEGRVLWRTAEGRERMMEPGQILEYAIESEKIQVSSVDVYPYVAWKEGRFVFEGATLDNIMQALSRWYGVSVVYNDNKVKDLHFSVDVQRYEDLRTILNMLALTQKVTFEIEGSEVRIIKHL